MSNEEVIFDATVRSPFNSAAGPDGLKTIRVRIPPDDEWTDRQRRRKVIIKCLGRQRSETTVANCEDVDAAYLAGPTQVMLTTSWQRSKITGTLASGQAGLWIVVHQYATNGDDWTIGDIHHWGACLQQGDDPQAAYART